jgi:AraC-like DNA-binding protein
LSDAKNRITSAKEIERYVERRLRRCHGTHRPDQQPLITAILCPRLYGADRFPRRLPPCRSPPPPFLVESHRIANKSKGLTIARRILHSTLSEWHMLAVMRGAAMSQSTGTDVPFGSRISNDLLRAGALKELASLIERYGGNAGWLCGKFGIDLSYSDQPDRFISCSAFLNLLEYCSNYLGVPFFGLELSRQQTLDTFGPIKALLRSAETLREALQYLGRYQSVYVSSMAYLLVDGPDRMTEFCAINRLSGMSHKRQGIELGLALITHMINELLSSDFQPGFVRIATDKPNTDLRIIRTHFGCEVMYGQAISSIAIPTEALSKTLSTKDKFLVDLVRSHLDGIGPRSHVALDQQLEVLINALLPYGSCTLDVCARQLGLAPRTLQAHLAAQGTEFSSLLAKRRRLLAEDYLSDTQLSVIDIASVLGYSDQATFTRAFRAWTGHPPSTYRKAHRATR